MNLSFWLEPTWLAYPTAALAILTFLFALSVRWTLKAHPVPVLNYAYEPLYRQPRREWQIDGKPTNYSQVFAATATSAVAYVPMSTREQIAARAWADAMWGHLPGVGS